MRWDLCDQHEHVGHRARAANLAAPSEFAPVGLPMTSFVAGLMALAAAVAVVREVRREPTKPGSVTVVLYTAAVFVALWLGVSAWSSTPLGSGLPGLAAVLTLYFLSVLVRMARWP
jgi:hypothetical protein